MHVGAEQTVAEMQSTAQIDGAKFVSPIFRHSSGPFTEGCVIRERTEIFDVLSGSHVRWSPDVEAHYDMGTDEWVVTAKKPLSKKSEICAETPLFTCISQGAAQPYVDVCTVVTGNCLDLDNAAVIAQMWPRTQDDLSKFEIISSKDLECVTVSHCSKRYWRMLTKLGHNTVFAHGAFITLISSTRIRTACVASCGWIVDWPPEAMFAGTPGSSSMPPRVKVVALRDIAEGEVLTVNWWMYRYPDVSGVVRGMTPVNRRNTIYERTGYLCKCRLCTDDDKEKEANASVKSENRCSDATALHRQYVCSTSDK